MRSMTTAVSRPPPLLLLFPDGAASSAPTIPHTHRQMGRSFVHARDSPSITARAKTRPRTMVYTSTSGLSFFFTSGVRSVLEAPVQNRRLPTRERGSPPLRSRGSAAAQTRRGLRGRQQSPSPGAQGGAPELNAAALGVALVLARRRDASRLRHHRPPAQHAAWRGAAERSSSCVRTEQQGSRQRAGNPGPCTPGRTPRSRVGATKLPMRQVSARPSAQMK